jgi:hypothetical protein
MTSHGYSDYVARILGYIVNFVDLDWLFLFCD